MKLSRIKIITKAEVINNYADIDFRNLLLDSRKIIDPEKSLFVALKGPRRDGHQFIKEVYEKGVRGFLISEPQPYADFPDALFIKVDDTLAAIQQMAAYHRNQFHFPVIGITGSNGKTIMKEWLFQLLSATYQIVRSPKSFNSQIGVPLSVWQIKPGDNLGIFEAGISQPGEMEKLAPIIRPDIGVFTHIGDAHSEGFLNIRQKIREKLLLFRNVRTLIYCKDHQDVNENIVEYCNHIRNPEEEGPELFTWSERSEATLRIRELDKQEHRTVIRADYKERGIQIAIPFRDSASIENAIHCWCVLLLLNVPDAIIAKRMELLLPVAMRLELLHGINNSTLINDTYNSDLTSLHIALDLLAQQKQHPHKTLILSDLLQMGRPDGDLYEEVAAGVAQKGIQRMIGIGTAISRQKTAFRKYKNMRSIFFKSTEDFLKKIHLLSFDNEAILLKGARIFRFEKIEKLLEQKIHKTVLEINLSALAHNLAVYRSMLPPRVKFMAMVKAFSYGSGSYEIASVLQQAGVDYLAVAYADEGVALRKAGITLPVMVMSPEPGAFDRMISWKLEPEIFSIGSLHAFEEAAQTLGVSHYPVHIKLDTGMHRLGFMEAEIGDLKNALQYNETIHVQSIFSHLAGSDAAELDPFTGAQAALFQKMAADIQEVLSHKPLWHILNSAGISRHPGFHFDMVRLGLGLYGIDGAAPVQARLQNTGTLKTTIAQIRHLNAGETVGYGRKGAISRDSVIATVSIGYADGYFRDFGNGKGRMLLNGKKVPVIGSVCMDMCMLDITDAGEAHIGDEVIVFGDKLPLAELALWAGTIPYEIMTGISQRVNRVYVNE